MLEGKGLDEESEISILFFRGAASVFTTPPKYIV